MGHILWVEPVFKEMIWGGNQLKEKYGYAIPSDQTGECWAPSAHPNGDNTIKEGEFKGQTLSKVFDEHRELFGNIKDKQFPLLVKIIDACNDLSVQVHPNDDYDHLLNKFDIKKGDFFYIPSGTIHAICKGSLIYEAQQSSDITYRVYDYHRKDKDGNERQLHVKQSIDVTTVPYKPYDLAKQVEETIENGARKELVSSNYLTLNKYDMTGYNKVKNDKPFQLVSIIEGQGTVEGKEVKKGDHFVVCSDQKEVDFDGTMTVMICTL